MTPFVGMPCLFRERGSNEWNAAIVTAVKHDVIHLHSFGTPAGAQNYVKHIDAATANEQAWKECEIPSEPDHDQGLDANDR